MKTALIFLAEGFEEMEAVTPADLLRRIGMEVKLVSVTGFFKVVGAHGITCIADTLFDEQEAAKADVIILPGGMPGTLNLLGHEGLRRLILLFHKEEKPICAICAAPLILGELGLLEGRRATIYPGMEERLLGARAVGDPLCRDGHILTSRGPGTAIPFSLALAEWFSDAETAQKLKNDIVYLA